MSTTTSRATCTRAATAVTPASAVTPAAAAAAVAAPRDGSGHRWRSPGTPAGRGPFERPLRVPGWSARSRWGFDPRLECFWVELWPEAGDAPLRIGPEHLVATVDGLARVLAVAGEVDREDAYLALTA